MLRIEAEDIDGHPVGDLAVYDEVELVASRFIGIEAELGASSKEAQAVRRDRSEGVYLVETPSAAHARGGEEGEARSQGDLGVLGPATVPEDPEGVGRVCRIGLVLDVGDGLHRIAEVDCGGGLAAGVGLSWRFYMFHRRG